MPSRRAISRVATWAENFRRMISRTSRIGTLSAGIGRSLGLPKEPTSSGQRRRSSPFMPRAGSFRSGGRHHLVMPGGFGRKSAWLAPFVSALRHKARARMCPAYIAGLMGAGDRKSVQPMAARDGEVGYDQLHHFIASGVWDTAPLEKALLAEANRMVGGDNAWLIVDDTALPKKGETLGWRRAAICFRTGKDGQLSVAGLADARFAGGPGYLWGCGCSFRKSGPAIPSAWRGLACRRSAGPR